MAKNSVSRRRLLHSSAVTLVGAFAGCVSNGQGDSNSSTVRRRSRTSVLDHVREIERDHIQEIIGTNSSVQCDSALATKIDNEYYASAVCSSPSEDIPAEPSIYLDSPNSTVRISRYSDTKRLSIRPSGKQRPPSFSPQIHLFNFMQSTSNVELSILDGAKASYSNSFEIQKYKGVELWNIVPSPGEYVIKTKTNDSTITKHWKPTEKNDKPIVVVVRPNGQLLSFMFEYPCVPSPVGGSCTE